jgi:hypothetical protein
MWEAAGKAREPRVPKEAYENIEEIRTVSQAPPKRAPRIGKDTRLETTSRKARGAASPPTSSHAEGPSATHPRDVCRGEESLGLRVQEDGTIHITLNDRVRLS